MDDPPKPTRRRRVLRLLPWLLGFVIALVIIRLLAQRTYSCDWTGFGYCPSKDARLEKTLWDWLSVAGFPLTLTAAGFYLTHRDKKVEEQRAERQRQTTEETLREAALQTYFDRISALLIDHDLGKAHATSTVVVAQPRTETVLHTLDSRRKPAGARHTAPSMLY